MRECVYIDNQCEQSEKKYFMKEFHVYEKWIATNNGMEG